MAKNTLIYLGDDSGYVAALQGEIAKRYPEMMYKIVTLSTKIPADIQPLHLSVIKAEPKAVLIDFSKNLDEVLHLARLLVRTNNFTPFQVFGLHDYLASPLQLKESILSGVKFNYIKSSEIYDTMFGIHNTLNPDKMKEHGFATTACQETSTATFLSKVGYLNSTGMHIETDINFGPGNTLKIHNFWTDNKIITSNAFQTISQGTSLLFYNLKYFLNVNFNFADQPILSDSDLPERTLELKEQYEQNLKQSKKKLKAWLEDNQYKSLKKKVRVLVLDEQMTLHNDRQRIDKYPYSIRCQPYLLDPVNEILNFAPQIIAFCMKTIPKDAEGNPLAVQKVENPSPENNLEMLQKIVQTIKAKMPESPPFIIIFNAESMTSDFFQAQNKYPQALCFPGPFTADLINKIAVKLETKISEEHEAIKNVDPYTLFLKKNSAFSIVEIEEDISIIQISETDVVFTSNREYAPFVTLHLLKPFDGYFTILPHSKFKHPQYYALINGIGEIEKKNLRKFVNSIFFRDKEAAKKAELDAYLALNQQKLDAKAEADRLALEAKAKEEQEKLEAEAQEKGQKMSAPNEVSQDNAAESDKAREKGDDEIS